MNVGSVVVIGAAGALAVGTAWWTLGRLVWVAARIQREIDDHLSRKPVRRYRNVTKVRVINYEDDFAPVEAALRERARKIDVMIAELEEDLREIESAADQLATSGTLVFDRDTGWIVEAA